MLSVSRAPWASRWGARLTLSVFLWGTIDPTLRRLRAPLSGATKQGRPYGAFGATRRVGVAVRPFGRGGVAGAAAPGRQPYIGRGHRRGAAILPLGASRFGCSGEAALQGR